MTVQGHVSIKEMARSSLRAWIPVLGGLLITAIVFSFLFWQEIGSAVRVWLESTAYNHCFLVLPMAAMLLWLRRPILHGIKPRSAPWAVFIVLALSSAWFLAALLDVLEAEQLLIVALFEALLLAIVGLRVFK